MKSAELESTLGDVERDPDLSTSLETPEGNPAQVFTQILDGVIACLSSGTLDVPQDELHQEILLPLLPAMLADGVIRQHWQSQATAGFLPALRAHLERGAPRPEWVAGDFEIHVAASYAAGPDAKALADTLLSEESLRDLTASLMNAALMETWPCLAPQGAAPMAEEVAPELATTAPVKSNEEVVLPQKPEVSWIPLIRPQPWEGRGNPLAGSKPTGDIADSNWQKGNPLDPSIVRGSMPRRRR